MVAFYSSLCYNVSWYALLFCELSEKPVRREIAVERKTIAILLAVYEPNEDWLCQLLDSLNAQTYPDLHLYVREDCSPTYSRERLEEALRQHVTRFPYSVAYNEQNLGSNRTFARLVEDASEPYIAFCDQDDVWLPDKLGNTLACLEANPEATLACTNVSVMDGEGKEIAPTIDSHRKRHVFLRGKGLAKDLIYRNFVMGCTVVMERERALSYLPFPAELVHDHYLAYRAALDGSIEVLDTPQMRYRIYGGNQTGVMTGVQTRADYRERRIEVFCNRVSCLSSYASFPELEEARAWGEARRQNFDHVKGSFSALYRMRSINPSTTYFEQIALRFPRPLFRLAIRMIRRGLL